MKTVIKTDLEYAEEVLTEVREQLDSNTPDWALITVELLIAMEHLLGHLKQPPKPQP